MVVCRMTLMVCKKKRSKIEKKTKWWKLKKEECCEEFRQKLRQALGGQVVLPDDWETTAEVIRETGRKVLGVSSGRRKKDKETWWWNEEVQDSIQRKRLAEKKWDMDRTEGNRQEYKELQCRVKREVSKAKQKAYDELYTRLDTREGQKDLYRLARQRDRDGKDVQQARVIKDREGRVLTNLEKAYDRVPREELWYCMKKSGVAEKYVRVVQDMYERSRTVVRCAVGQTEEFKVEVGLHQGSALSPFLFAIVMDQLSEEVRQESPWTMMFADDIVICSESREQVEENLERWRVDNLKGKYKRHLSTTSNSQTPNSTMAKTKELSKDTRNKIVDLHQAGKTESAIGLVDGWMYPKKPESNCTPTTSYNLSMYRKCNRTWTKVRDATEFTENQLNLFSNLSNSSSSVGPDHTGQPSLPTCINEPRPPMTTADQEHTTRSAVLEML
ncbi:hypothetical protein QTP86_002995 [Hemibagrus guttatus]|nr:hypothetical protein QTP86_002995 [Hemibagrus guttatus]